MLLFIWWILLLSCVIVAIQRIPAAAFFVYARPVKQAKDGAAPRRARSFWRCCCSLPLLPTSHARSSVRLDTNAVRRTRPTPNDVPFDATRTTQTLAPRGQAPKLMQMIGRRGQSFSHTHARARANAHSFKTYLLCPSMEILRWVYSNTISARKSCWWANSQNYMVNVIYRVTMVTN